jgi:DeoR/GlpR family transcriptional regulator of sugar metabolism
MGENDHSRTGTRSVPEGRRLWIVDRIRTTGSVTITGLSEELGISPMTARRDLSALERDGWLRRTYGGAVLPLLAGHEDSFQARLDQAVDAKERLAKAAVDLIEPGEAAFVDCSTSSYHLVRALIAEGREATILTNSVPVMDLFRTGAPPRVDLIGLGGIFRRLSMSFVGPQTVTAARSHFADKAFLSVKGITRDGHLTDPDALETEVKRAMIERSEKSILLADPSKFQSRGLSEIGHISDVSLVLTAGAPEDLRRSIESMGVEVGDV